MTAGRELDAMIAERVMGFAWDKWPHSGVARLSPPDGVSDFVTVEDRINPTSLFVQLYFVPKYSTDIAAAFLVVEAMRAKGWRYTIEVIDKPGDPSANLVTCWRHDLPGFCDARGPLSLAICEASLAALDAASPTSEEGRNG